MLPFIVLIGPSCDRCPTRRPGLIYGRADSSQEFAERVADERAADDEFEPVHRSRWIVLLLAGAYFPLGLNC